MGNRIRYLCIGMVVALLVATASGLYGQSITQAERDRQIRDARGLAKLGQRDAAIRALERLYTTLPDDGVVVNALFKMLVEAERFDRAEDIMKPYLDRRTGDVKGQADLAGLYLQTDRRAEGLGLLNSIVERAPAEAWPYEIGVSVLVDRDMEDDALALISRARQALRDSVIFTWEAARIHREAGRYAMATREYLLGGTHPNASFESTSQRIIEMATDDAARRDVIAALENARGNEAFEKTLNWSLWRIYMLDGACEKAVGVLAEAAPKWQPYANQLPVLAREALAVGCYAECSRAYSLAAEYMDDKSKIPSLLLEKARCEVGGGLVEQALATYSSLIERYPATESAGSAALASGGIYRDLGRMEEALAEAERAITLSRERDGAHEAVLFKGDCLVKVGRLEEGFETYDLVQTEWKREHAQEAFFNLGEIAFYQARFDDATGYYNVTLREYPDEPRANDAIDRLMLLKASKAGEAYDAGLTDLAHAMLLKRQRSYTEAETAFRMLAAGDAGAIKIESLRNLSEMYLEQGALEDAITTYLIIGDSLDAHLSPAALEIVGDIYADMGRTEDAVKAYEDVILRFPDSVSAGEARRKIEIARRGSGEDS